MSDSSILSALQQLLKLQDCDSSIGRLTYAREHLPAHSRLAEIQIEAAVLRNAIDDVTIRHRQAVSQQESLESEIAAIDKRIKEINARLYGTATVGARDAQAMADEVKHLEERRSDLEDKEFEVMEVLEPLEIELEQRQGEAQQLAERSRQALSEVAEGQGEIDQQLTAERQQRDALAERVPVDLLGTYETLRTKLGGVAIAPLQGASCGGCHLTLSSKEVDKVRHSVAAVSHCDECGRILVP